MKYFRVVTSVSFGGGGKFVQKHSEEDPTPKFVMYLYNEKVLYSLRCSTLYHININTYYNIQTDLIIHQKQNVIFISSSW